MAQYYYPVYLHIILLFSLIQYSQCGKLNADNLILKKRSNAAICFFVLFVFVIGFRPISPYFGDTVNYAPWFKAYQNGLIEYDSSTSEWLFQLIMFSCSKVMSVHGFFTIVLAGYVGFMLWACFRLMPNNVTIAMLFCYGAFSFFSYGTNGIRNGLACSFVILAISYITGNNRDKIVAFLLSYCAFCIHRSTALPILCMFITLFYKNTKVVYLFWLASILISAVAGGFMESLFTGLGFDDRLDHYIQETSDDDMFRHTGFRWDFLLYSSMPIVLGWYVVLKKKIVDRQYLMLLHTYVLSNAFWVMLIRASYSNRFAYLSWFLYPLVLAYPVLKLKIWKDQGKKTGLILMAQIVFTYLLWLRG